ncbi:MAG: hypothetical protein IJT49_01180 [Clostridia bacterium]|nr:hypothetical protein [Clostridia bacterium]
MQKKRKFNVRYIPLYVLYAAACTFFFVKLVNIQITGADRYVKTMSLTHEREVAVQSMRGEIYDRNGVPLAINEYKQSIQLDYASLPTDDKDRNETLASIISVLDKWEREAETVMPMTGVYPHIEYDNEELKSQLGKNRMYKFLIYHNIKSGLSCIDLYEELLNEFALLDVDGEHIYDPHTEDMIVRIRYSLDATDFAPGNPYPLCSDIDLKLATAILENGCKGVFLKKDCTRAYGVPGVGSNVIGRIGKIPEGKMEEYLEKGYAYDAVVGLDGAEAAFEDVLRGEDGITVYVEDDYGNVLDSYVKKEPVPGRNVYLTIDIKLQEAAEKALGEQIRRIVYEARASGIENSGEKANSGALTVFSAKTGQVLALASYPTYDLTTFADDYSKLVSDPAKPLFDRTVSGTYQPGSTFKLATAIAGLMSNTITQYTSINDTGKYTYYSDYQPSCWLKNGHGELELIDAIGASCNYYFYETGRRTGIDEMNKYCSQLGLGEYTGIELPESKGILASPGYKESIGQRWNPGDTLQAAIGQSYNSFTPLQLSSYIASAVNGGTRYKATLLLKTCNYSGADVQTNSPQVLGTVDIDETAQDCVKRGMKRSKELTSSTKGYKFPIGTKTGTAQTSKTNNNAVLVAFAPYDDPEITLSCVIENGAAGGNAARPVLDTISYYFNLDKNGNRLSSTED